MYVFPPFIARNKHSNIQTFRPRIYSTNIKWPLLKLINQNQRNRPLQMKPILANKSKWNEKIDINHSMMPICSPFMWVSLEALSHTNTNNTTLSPCLPKSFPSLLHSSKSLSLLFSSVLVYEIGWANVYFLRHKIA